MHIANYCRNDMIKHYSNNIQNVIQGELFNASSSIKIAVAWFTNNLLFQPLLMKLALGVKVDILLNKDEINLSSSGALDFNQFVEQGGNLYWNESNRLMHDKFCIIDNRVVIAGSYNWTNKAEINYESISVFTDEYDTLSDYENRFERLSKEFVRQIVQVRPQPALVNKGKCPVSLQPYPKLKFYHSVKLFHSSTTPILANQCEGGSYALLDNKTFLPRTQYMFSDYSSFIPARNYLWLRGETKWGLFDCEKLEYVVKPQFDKINNSSKNGTIVRSNSKYGIVSNNGKILLSCEYDEINESNNCLILRKGVKYGLLWTESSILIPSVYDSIPSICQKSSDFGAIVEQNGKYGLIHTSGKELLPCIYDTIEDCNYSLKLRKYGKLGLYNICNQEPSCKFDTMDKLDDGGRIWLLGQYLGNGILYGVSKFHDSIALHEAGRFSQYAGADMPDLFSCKYNKITYKILSDCETLHFQKEININGITSTQHSLYIVGKGLLLGGIDSYYSKISYCSKYDINLIILHKGEKIRIYLINQHKELRGFYDGISLYKGVICLKKNGMFGAYIVGSQKYIDCRYNKISHNAWDDSLYFSNDIMPCEDIRMQL